MLSKTCIYAIKIMIFLASVSEVDRHRVSVGQIAAGIDSPRQFTAKVLQRLTKARLVRSVPGPGGGYYLEGSLDYTLTRVMAALNEDYILTACVLGFEECSEANPCPLHDRFVRARSEMKAVFGKMTIAEIGESVRRGESTLIG
jgi:Rrf2 family protein